MAYLLSSFCRGPAFFFAFFFSFTIFLSESYGEDIAATESERSSDDEDYGGSFINDGDPGAYSASSGSMDEGMLYHRMPLIYYILSISIMSLL